MQLIARKIKKIRCEKNISQSWVAMKLGIHRTTYTEIENGNIELTVTRLFEIITLLDLKYSDILPDDPKNYCPPS
jgi:DNA-binding XRE family transcriptional regulator